MPYSSGTWTAAANSWNPSVAQTAISVADWATLLADISTGLSTCILKDGSQTATALVPFAAGLSAGAAAAFNINSAGAITTAITMSTAASRVVPGATSFAVRNNANTADNVLITDAGEMTKPQQPAFLAYNSVSDTNATGNGTAVTVDFDTEVFDQNSDFGADTFTAPVTGRYQLTARVGFNEANTATLSVISIVTSNRTYRNRSALTVNASDVLSLMNSVLADMDAADTATVSVALTGIGADTADIIGAATLTETSFSGFLAC